jgi:hypothetical protein
MAEAVTVLVHEPGWSEEELLVNPQSFPDVKVDDYLELVSPDDPECSVVLRVRSLSDVKGNMQVSILKDVAQVLSHLHGQKLIVRPANLASHALDFVEISFKDQFLSRSDIWYFKRTMVGNPIYVGKNVVNKLGVRGHVNELLASDKQSVRSGVVTDNTKYIFRSRSARFFWLVQVSAEMWQFADNSELMHEKLVNGFMDDLLERWKQAEVTHSLTVIFFSRAYLLGDSKDGRCCGETFGSAKQSEGQGQTRGSLATMADFNEGKACTDDFTTCIEVDKEGRPYIDFYKVRGLFCCCCCC